MPWHPPVDHVPTSLPLPSSLPSRTYPNVPIHQLARNPRSPQNSTRVGEPQPRDQQIKHERSMVLREIGVCALGAVEARFCGRGGCFGGGGGVGVWVGHVGRAAGVGGHGCVDDGEEGRGCGGEEDVAGMGGQGGGVSDWGEMFLEGGGGGG